MFRISAFTNTLLWQMVLLSLAMYSKAGLSQSSSTEHNSSNRGQYGSGSVFKLVDNQPVSRSQKSMLQSPIDAADNYLYVVNIEMGADGDGLHAQLQTVLRQGVQNEGGEWNWSSVVIDNRTVYDLWHTAPSVGIDKDGFVHVAYNMHNTPWQYKVSTYPHDISDFEYKGQHISDREIDLWKYQNRTNFPTLGTASIPGNQITYPIFSRDVERNLYVSYRFASKPKRKFSERAMSAGIARYDSSTKSWTSIGGNILVDESDRTYSSDSFDQPSPFATEQGWTVSAPELAFGPSNEMYASFRWRHGKAGALYTRPCVVTSNDSASYHGRDNSTDSLPITLESCGNLGFDSNYQFYSLNKMAVSSQSTISLLSHTVDNKRLLSQKQVGSQEWEHKSAPPGATDVFYDGQDNLWSVGTGLTVYKKPYHSDHWTTIFKNESNNDCYPKVVTNDRKDRAYIHTHSCDGSSISVYALQLQ